MDPAYRPMLATLVDEPFDDKDWVFETKWDGFRLITEKRGHAVRLWSPVLLPALRNIDGSCALDGEICAPQIASLRLNLVRHVGKAFRRFLGEVHRFKKCA